MGSPPIVSAVGGGKTSDPWIRRHPGSGANWVRLRSHLIYMNVVKEIMKSEPELHLQAGRPDRLSEVQMWRKRFVVGIAGILMIGPLFTDSIWSSDGGVHIVLDYVG